MERTSTQHGPRIDDELARETETLTRGNPAEARAQEWRMAEPPGDGEPLADARIASSDDDATLSLPVDELEARSELAISLRPSAFPADAPTLRRVARDEDAPAWVFELLDVIDPVTRYENVQQLWDAAGGHRERRDRDHDTVDTFETPFEAEPPDPEPAGRTARRPVADAPVTRPAVADTALPEPHRPLDDIVRLGGFAVNVAMLPARIALGVGKRTLRALTGR